MLAEEQGTPTFLWSVCEGLRGGEKRCGTDDDRHGCCEPGELVMLGTRVVLNQKSG